MKAIITNESKDNNPSPQEAIDKIEIRIGSMSLQLGKEFKIIEQALTNYANMVEMLEGFKNDYQTDLRWVIEQLENSKITAQQEVKYELRKELYNSFIADITKVLEGKVNE
jgi:sugar-specific transcriptional regulator TrmB